MGTHKQSLYNTCMCICMCMCMWMWMCIDGFYTVISASNTLILILYCLWIETSSPTFGTLTPKTMVLVPALAVCVETHMDWSGNFQTEVVDLRILLYILFWNIDLTSKKTIQISTSQWHIVLYILDIIYNVRLRLEEALGDEENLQIP